MDTTILESMGLTKGEVNVYLTLLKIGNTTSGAIITESHVSRSKVYDVLERLKKKGLVTEMIKENVRYFETTGPNKILDYLNTKKKDIENKIIESKKIIQELTRIQNSNINKQEAKVYTGKEGWKTAYAEILEKLKNNEEYLAFGIGENEMNDKETVDFIKKFHMRREEKRINARIIMQNSTRNKMRQFRDLRYYKYKFTNVDFPTNIAIYQDTVLTLVSGETPVIFEIKSKQVADKYRVYFNTLWKKSS